MGKFRLPPSVMEWLLSAGTDGLLADSPSAQVRSYCVDRWMVRWLHRSQRWEITKTGRSALNPPSTGDDKGAGK